MVPRKMSIPLGLKMVNGNGLPSMPMPIQVVDFKMTSLGNKPDDEGLFVSFSWHPHRQCPRSPIFYYNREICARKESYPLSLLSSSALPQI